LRHSLTGINSSILLEIAPTAIAKICEDISKRGLVRGAKRVFHPMMSFVLSGPALINRLCRCQLFSGLPQPDLENIAAITMVKTLEKDQYLFHEGDPSHGFYVVHSGAINLHRISSSGKEQVIHIFRSGEAFAEATLATLTGYPADARAVESSQLLLIQKAGFV